jgi:hypothetical protein
LRRLLIFEGSKSRPVSTMLHHFAPIMQRVSDYIERALGAAPK